MKKSTKSSKKYIQKNNYSTANSNSNYNSGSYSEDTDTDTDVDSYEEVLYSAMQRLKKQSSLENSDSKSNSNSISNTGSNTNTNATVSQTPTEIRLGFVKHVLDGNNLQPMINIDNCEMNHEINKNYLKLKKKTMDVKELFKSMNLGLEYIKSGTTGHTFKAVSKKDHKLSFAIKVCAYPKEDDYGGIQNPNRPENAELRMLKLLSDFVITMKTPHLILPIGTFNTSIKPFINIPTNLVNLTDDRNQSYRDFIEKYENNEFDDLVSVLISEWANGGDLLDYIRRHYKKMTLETWTIIFFQILFTLATIQKHYASFRHNDLKANNILVVILEDEEKDKLYGYAIKNEPVKFKIPAIGIQTKIWDFDFACIDGIIENNKVNSDWTRKMNISKIKNQYYDIHYFFNTLIWDRFFPYFYTSHVPKEIVDFVHRVVPEDYRSICPTKYTKKGGRILINKEYTTPYKLIMEDPLFSKYRYNC